jgi:hypothetical protein
MALYAGEVDYNVASSLGTVDVTVNELNTSYSLSSPPFLLQKLIRSTAPTAPQRRTVSLSASFRSYHSVANTCIAATFAVRSFSLHSVDFSDLLQPSLAEWTASQKGPAPPVAMHGGHHGQMAPMGVGGYAPQGMMYRAFSPFFPFFLGRKLISSST